MIANEETPKLRRGAKKYRFEKLDVGACVSYPRADERRIRVAAAYYNRKHGVKLTVSRARTKTTEYIVVTRCA